MTGGRIERAERGTTQYIRMTGFVRHTISAGLARHIEELEGREDIDSIRVDLTAARALDSTNLGLLARLARLLRRRQGGRVALHSTHPEINRILEAMGFDRVFEILATPLPDPPEFRSLVEEHGSDRSQGRIILDAHRILAGMDPAKRREFGPLVDMLRRELDREDP